MTEEMIKELYSDPHIVLRGIAATLRKLAEDEFGQTKRIMEAQAKLIDICARSVQILEELPDF